MHRRAFPILLLAGFAASSGAANLVGLMNQDATHKALVVFNPATGAASQLGASFSAGAMASGAGAINATSRQLHFAALEPVSGQYRLFTVDLASGAVVAQPQITPPAGYESLPLWLVHDGTRLLGLMHKDATHKSLVQLNPSTGAATVLGAELTIGETWNGVASFNPATGVIFFAATDGATSQPRLYRMTAAGGVATNPVISVPAGVDPVPLALVFDTNTSSVRGLWRDSSASRIDYGAFVDVTLGTTAMLGNYAAWGASSGVAAFSPLSTRFFFAANDAALGEPRRLVSLDSAAGTLKSFVPVSNATGLDNTPQWLGAYTTGGPGRVPDGLSGGSPMRVAKSGANLALQWSRSCAPAATDYTIYQGTLGSWYSHSSLLCTTGGALSATVTPSAGSRYYLIVPVAAATEGSYGTDSSGVDIPAAATRCYAPLDFTSCGAALSDSH